MTEIDNYKQSSVKLFASAGIQPQSKFITTNGPVEKIHYWEIGSGKPLILIHGGGAHAMQMYPLVKPLQEKFHLYILDRPGCGLTDFFDYEGVNLSSHATDFVRSFMDAVGIDKAYLAGNSMGSLFCVNFALKYPQRVEKLLIVGQPAGGGTWLPVIMKLMSIKGVNSLIMKIMGKPNREATRKFFGMMLVADASKLTDDFLDNDVCAQLLPDTGKGFMSIVENGVGMSGFKKKYLISPRMKELTMPVRYIIGDKDPFDTPEHTKEIVAEMKDGKVEVVKGGGHILWLDEPDICSRLILQALN